VSGRLVVCPTPIGNLEDVTLRVLAALREADVVACEDTRRTGRLLQLSGIRARGLLTVNDHTEAAAVRDVLRRLDAGERVVVVSDAGTPGISDPGERLVRAAALEGHEVVVVPGPSAAIAALVASGLPTGRFVFEGFLPRKGSQRSERLRSLATEPRTVVLYEAPHRIAKTLADLALAFGPDRRVAVGRELTKLHEEVWRGSLAEAVEWARSDPPGEMVVVVDGAPEREAAGDDEIRSALRVELGAGASARDAATSVASALGVARRRAYELAIELRAAG
jgi:16S rRNA (cytidine1402-2'-O)-methyltransferase